MFKTSGHQEPFQTPDFGDDDDDDHHNYNNNNNNNSDVNDT